MDPSARTLSPQALPPLPAAKRRPLAVSARGIRESPACAARRGWGADPLAGDDDDAPQLRVRRVQGERHAVALVHGPPAPAEGRPDLPTEGLPIPPRVLRTAVGSGCVASPYPPGRACAQAFTAAATPQRYALSGLGETWNTSCRSRVTKDVHALTATCAPRCPAGTSPNSAGGALAVQLACPPLAGWRGTAPSQREGGHVAVSGHSSGRTCDGPATRTAAPYVSRTKAGKGVRRCLAPDQTLPLQLNGKAMHQYQAQARSLVENSLMHSTCHCIVSPPTHVPSLGGLTQWAGGWIPGVDPGPPCT